MHSNVHDDVTILKFVDSPKTQAHKHLESETYERL